MLQLRNGLDAVKASNPIVADIVHWYERFAMPVTQLTSIVGQPWL